MVEPPKDSIVANYFLKAPAHSLTVSSASRKLSPARKTHLSWDIPFLGATGGLVKPASGVASERDLRSLQTDVPHLPGLSSRPWCSHTDNKSHLSGTCPVSRRPLNQTPHTCHPLILPATLCCLGGSWGSLWSHTHPGYTLSEGDALPQSAPTLCRAKSTLLPLSAFKEPLEFSLPLFPHLLFCRRHWKLRL